MSESVFLCKLEDLSRSGAFGVTVNTNGQQMDIVVVRDPQGSDAEPLVRAYHNACPHLSIPLETFEHDFVDRDNEALLVCSTHGARFQISDGICILGPCEGASLTQLSITIRKNEIFLIG